MISKDKERLMRPKIGDSVRINTPSMFVRCGYPMTISEVKEDIESNNLAEIEDFINDIIGNKEIDIMSSRFKIRKRSIQEIVSALAYEKMRFNGFGGRTRSIYTEDVENLRGKVAKVIGTKMCVTGDYVHGYGGYDYYSGGYEYEPAYLMNQKHHRILILDYIPAIVHGCFQNIYSGSMIEDCHVTKVESERIKK